MTSNVTSPTLMEVRGSRLRCLLLTGLPRVAAAQALTDLTDGKGSVTLTDEWMPKGILNMEEAKVHGVFPGSFPLINATQRKDLLDWWLHTQRNANTPNWDIVSTCTIEGRRGLLLVEAKAHKDELSNAGKSAEGNQANHDSIQDALKEAANHLNTPGVGVNGWNLRHDHNYQLANRFAWAWKFASMKIPVILVYLGFRNATEMGKNMFGTHAEWKACVLAHAASTVPQNAWGQRLDIGGTPLFPLIRSLDMGFHL